MKKSRSSFLIFAFLFSAAFCGAENSSGENAHRVSIETISDLKLSGYHDDERGDLQWRLEAESAEADPQTRAEDIRRARWNLRRLRLQTFGKNGEKFAEMTSPEGRFSPEKREADSEARVEVKGADFTVRGRGWSWSGRGHDNLIRVHDSVFVSITQPDKEENLTVLSKRLSIQGTETQTVLTFSGGVSVAYGEIHMSSDTLEIVVPESGDGLESGIGGLDARERGGELNSVRSITGRGGVRISRGQTQIEGDTAEFFPGENLFFVRGNACLNDFTGQLSVRGDEAVGKIDEQLVEITATKPNNALPLSPVAVSVEMPSFAVRGNGSFSDVGEKTRTVVTGKRMTVRSTDSKNEVALFGEVHVEDRDIRIDADRLVVTADPSGDVPLFQSETAAGERSGREDLRQVRAVEAEGSVRADYAGRVLYCDRAEVFPQDSFILLTGTPRVVSGEENASLSGDRVEIFLDRDQIEVFSEKSGNAPRRRVTVELPGISAAAADKKAAVRGAGSPGGNAASVTEIIGDHLTLTRGDGLSTFDIFGNVFLKSDALRGSCDRIVVFADPKSPQGDGDSRAKTDISQLRKIIALGDVELAQDGYELSGGKATITPAVGLKEWVTEDGSEEFSDGKTPFFVVVEPDPKGGPRPRITFPEDAAGAKLEFSLPTNAGGNGAAESSGRVPVGPPDDAPEKKSSLESDSMELIAGESRARFFLRGDVVFETTGGARGICDSVEGLLAPQSPDADSGGFEAKKVICRGNVRLTHDGSTGRGSTLEIFPPENKAVLSGNAHFRDKDGTELFPGNDRFVFDLAKRQMITTSATGANGAVPAQVARPQIIIPKGSNRVFVIPKSVRGNDSAEEDGGEK